MALLLRVTLLRNVRKSSVYHHFQRFVTDRQGLSDQGSNLTCRRMDKIIFPKRTLLDPFQGSLPPSPTTQLRSTAREQKHTHLQHPQLLDHLFNPKTIQLPSNLNPQLETSKCLGTAKRTRFPTQEQSAHSVSTATEGLSIST